MSPAQGLASVTELPDSMQRQWRVYEGELTSYMAELGASKEEIGHIRASIKPVFLEAANMRKGFSCKPEDVLKSVDQWVRQQVLYL